MKCPICSDTNLMMTMPASLRWKDWDDDDKR